jgi:hypothetical protein
MALYDAYAVPQAQQWAKEHMLTLEGGNYGGVQQFKDMKPPRAHGRGIRRQLNCVAILLALLVPFGLFAFTFYLMSFEPFYKHAGTAVWFVLLAFFFVLVIGALSTQAKRTEMLSGQATWHSFIFMTGLLACLLGSGLGVLNMRENAFRYYDYISLRKATDVDPTSWRGQAMLDAGEIDFVAGSKVDTNYTSLWKHGRTYCVAPLVFGDGKTLLANYDFWSVGVDCCSAKANDFSCGDLDPSAPAGLRVMDNSEIQGYRLAVEQATAHYNIQSQRPIFLNMMKQPYTQIRSYWENAKEFAIWAHVLYFILQGAAVLLQAASFGKDAPSGYLDMDGGKAKNSLSGGFF